MSTDEKDRLEEPQEPDDEQTTTPEGADGEPQVFAVQTGEDRQPRFNRRQFLEIAAASAAILSVGGKIALDQVKGGDDYIAGAGTVYLFAGPSTSYKLLEQLSEGLLVRLIGRNSDHSWIQVTTPAGNTGWVQRIYLDFNRAVYGTQEGPGVDEAPEPSATPTPLSLNAQSIIYLPIIFRDHTPTNTPCGCDTYCACDTECGCDGYCSCDQHCSCDDICTCDLVCTCDSIHYWYPN